ncbi:putative toxin-antitoxin system toxin component, PIN family [Spirosoma koreense]
MPKKRKIRLVIDANWFISACISRNSRRTLYYKIIKNAHLQIYYSSELLTEFEGVISRPKFSKVIRPHQVARFKAFTLFYLHEVSLGEIPSLSRDEADNYLLAIAESSQADFLITGDNDLLTLGTYQNTTIVTMGQFLQIVSLIR